jgi:nitrate/TMAO reductase-like tetraheme cytochrome c subunit
VQTDDNVTQQGNILKRTWRWLSTPSAKWSVLSLLIVGLLVGAGMAIGTQVMVATTGTNEFCGGACHSMQWVTQEYKQSSHFANSKGVGAGCHDCHIPDSYPKLLWYKAKAGIYDAIGEMSGTISTEEKFKKERLRMAKSVWAEYKANNSENCQHCHKFNAQVVAKQQEFVRPMHEQFLAKTATCIDCHKGIAHTAPDE